jgi:hypothetical protein
MLLIGYLGVLITFYLALVLIILLIYIFCHFTALGEIYQASIEHIKRVLYPSEEGYENLLGEDDNCGELVRHT